MKKIKAQTEFIKDFRETYELSEQDINLTKEECLAERVAVTLIKNNCCVPEANKLVQNEFTSNQNKLN